MKYRSRSWKLHKPVYVGFTDKTEDGCPSLVPDKPRRVSYMTYEGNPDTLQATIFWRSAIESQCDRVQNGKSDKFSCSRVDISDCHFYDFKCVQSWIRALEEVCLNHYSVSALRSIVDAKHWDKTSLNRPCLHSRKLGTQ